MDDVDLEAMAARHSLLWDKVLRVQAPALVVRGAESDVLTTEGAERLAAAMPQGRWVEVPRSGHTVQGDNAAGLLDVLRPFLATVTP
jgi:pimeloyl-ACP methyl ester carboxylesterase